MYAMQYEITLPADYDMSIIRHRVRTKGPLLDGLEGLGLKAYLLRTRGGNGSPVNEYAPFYLWSSIQGMNRFLWGGAGFAGIVASFGRPSVRHWTGVSCLAGPAVRSLPAAATRTLAHFPPDVDPAALVDAAKGRLVSQVRQPCVHSAAIAVDPRDWSLVHFTLWTVIPDDAPGTRYEVLHLSTPHFQDIVREIAPA